MKTVIPQSLILVLIVWFGSLQNTQAVMPPPDGGYPGGNTAEGHSALLSLTTGTYNTAIGFFSLDNNRTGSFNTAVGAGALFVNTGDQNTATGAAALLNNTIGTFNTANGEAALFFNTNGSSNTAVGSSALVQNTTGDTNTATGANALQSNTEGARNTAIGVGALLRSTGNDNIGVGAGAGTFLTTGDKNIYIGNGGVATEDNTIHIGDQKVHAATFIAGITGVDEGSPTAVFINTTTGQLGTTPPASSRRFKTDIKPMDQTSEAILALKPVTFEYKSDTNGRPQFGLIAEEVAKVNPALVLPDKEGKPYTVRYDAVNAMLLNEFLKAHRRMEEQEATIARQQKQIDALAAGLSKVSAQVDLSKSAPQTVLNNQ
jgi:Chaperone of endosialidase